MSKHNNVSPDHDKYASRPEADEIAAAKQAMRKTSRPQESVGSEGGVSTYGSPKHTDVEEKDETDAPPREGE